MIQANINNRWAQLSQGEKAELLGIYTRQGYNDLASIIAHYNSCGGKLYKDGGDTDDGIYLGELQPAIIKPNPVAVRLYTDPITKRTPITHSSLEMSEMDPVLGAGHSFFVSKGSNDPTYSLLYRNCSDATGEILEAISGQDFTSGITTPFGVRRKAREVFGNYPGYFEGVGPDYGADSPRSTVQYFEIPWYDYRVARDVATKRRAESLDKEARKAGIPDEKREEIIQYIYNDSPLLPYRLNEEASGGRIHIKPENRGKFTALKKRTGHSASWFKAHGTPAQKKMAVFALNAKKWNHADGGPLGEENEIQVNHIPNWTVFGTDYSTWKPSDIQNIIDWGYTDPESFFGEEGENTRNALSRAGMADSVIGDIYANMDPELQSKFGDRYKGTKQRQQEYIGGITNAIDSAGQRIYQIADTVAGFVPGPVGMIDWLGHMGADAVEGEFGKVGKDLALAAGLGFGARALGKGARYLKDYWDEIGNFGEDTFKALISGEPNSIESVNNILPIRRNVTPRALFDEEGNFIFGGEDAPIINDALAGNRSTAPTEILRASAPTIAKTTSSGYQIERYPGYMLQSLMEGNALEKQIGKNGTVSVNNIKALMKNAKKVDQAVVDKVLASEEFAGKKSIDYNKFRKTVQDELITYNRTPDTRWNNYGIDRLGIGSYMDAAESPEMRNKFNEFIMNNFSWDPVSDSYYIPGDPSSKSFDTNDLAEMFFEDGPGFLDIPVGVTKKLDTFTFSSSRIPNGSAKHYDANTLGHSRTYTTTDEPDVLHVMESQSDWAQEGKVSKNAAYVKERMKKHPGTEDDPDSWLSYAKEKIKLREEEVESFKKMIETGISENGEKLEPHAIKQIKEELLPSAERRLFDAKAHFLGPTPQEEYLSNNFTSRQIQENLRYAAEKGQTKMRYPTRETAAKIEGYSIDDIFVDESGRDVSRDIDLTSHAYGPVRKQLDDYAKELKKMQQEAEGVGASLSDHVRYDRMIRNRLNLLKANEDKLSGIRRKQVYMAGENPDVAESILRKYDAFPKQYQKLYKGADVRIVTDPKGNTWYEVDVPEGYLQQEWAYKNGGKLQQYADFSGFF